MFRGGTPSFREVTNQPFASKEGNEATVSHQSLKMKVHHGLICLFFFLSLQEGNTGLVNAQISVFSRTEGEDIRVRCPFSFIGSRMYFCKETCEQNIIFDTTADRDQRGRYSIEYKETSGRADVFVTIRNLMKSDSGLYRCGLIGQRNEYHPIRIIVVDAVLPRNPPEGRTLYTRTGGDIVVECSFDRVGSRKYFCRDDCEEKDILVQTSGEKVQNGSYSIELASTFTAYFVYVSITQLKKSDSGRYRCAIDRSFSSYPYHEFNINVTDDRTTSGPDMILPASTTSVSTPTTTTQSLTSEQETEPTSTTATETWLYVGVTLAVLVVLLSLAVLIYCRKKSAKPNDPPGETEYTSVTELNRVYEDIGEDRRSRSPPVEISSSHTYAIYTTPSGAGARSQDTAEDDSSKLTYSELNFSNRTFGSSSGVIRGDGGDVVYSVPRTQPSSDASHAKDDVYSTVT